MCDRQLFAQCETTQVTEHDKGAALYGYTKLYGQVPGGQAELLRVPHAGFGAIKVPEGPSDDRFVYLSDVVPTAWQAVQFADVPSGGTCVVFGLGPIGQMATRIARLRGADLVIGVDRVSERLAMARRHGIETIDTTDRSDEEVTAAIRELTAGRGADSSIDAVGMEAHGNPSAAVAQRVVGLLPDALSTKLIQKVGVDRMSALTSAIDAVRRGGTVSISGVYGGMADPMPMMKMFDKGLTLRMGQAHVKRWIPDVLPIVSADDDPLGTEDLATHHLPLSQAPSAYEQFQSKANGTIKVLLQP